MVYVVRIWSDFVLRERCLVYVVCWVGRLGMETGSGEEGVRVFFSCEVVFEEEGCVVVWKR